MQKITKSSNKKGKLIVIEGNDGSGKSTQVKLLTKYLKSKKIPVKTMDFPRYYDSFFGKFLAAFLRSEHGKLENANPYLLTFPYAMDRASAKDIIKKWIKDGNYLVFNRYATSNMAHQGGRVPEEERKKFVDWEMEFEYKINGLPKEDKVVFLHLPYMYSLKLLSQRGKRDYNNKSNKDMLETDVEYIKNSEQSYLELAKRFPHWITIECVKSGKLRSIEDIHEEIKRKLNI